MAEFVKVVTEKNRMCAAHGEYCDGCPLTAESRRSDIPCPTFLEESPEEAEEIILKWAAENPIMTNGAKFREVFGYDFVQAVYVDDWYNAEYKEPEEQEEEYT